MRRFDWPTILLIWHIMKLLNLLIWSQAIEFSYLTFRIISFVDKQIVLSMLQCFVISHQYFGINVPTYLDKTFRTSFRYFEIMWRNMSTLSLYKCIYILFNLEFLIDLHCKYNQIVVIYWHYNGYKGSTGRKLVSSKWLCLKEGGLFNRVFFYLS